MSKLMRAGIATLFTWVCIIAPPSLVSQGGGEVLTITLAGQGTAPANVRLSNGATRTSLAQVAVDQPLRLAMDAVNIGKGKRVAVNVAGENVVLIPEGVVDSGCTEAAASGSRDQCEQVAVVTWGEAATVGLGWSGGMLSAFSPARFGRFRIGADYALSSFTRLDEVACSNAIAGLTGCSNDNSGRGIGVYAEYGVAPWLGVGARYSSTGYQVMQQFGSTAVKHDVSLSMFDFYGRVALPGNGPIQPWGMLGGSWFDNEDDIDDGEGLRSESGLRLLFGGGLDLRVHDRFGLRGGVAYGSGGSDDADTHWRPTFGAHFNF